MKNQLLIFGLIVMLGNSFKLSAFCSFRLFKASNGKLVLIIGDLHDKERRFEQNVTCCIDILSKEKLKQQLEILAEIPEKLPTEPFGLAPSFARLCALKELVESQRGSSLRFTCCDPRGCISEQLGLLRIDLIKIILEVITKEDYEKFYGPNLPYAQVTKPWSEVQVRELARLARYKNPCLTLPEATLKHYLESLVKNLSHLDTILDRYREDEKVYEIFKKQYRARYDEACNTLRETFGEVFNGSSPNTDLCFILEKLHVAAQTTEDLLSTFIVFDGYMLDSIDNLFPTAVMLDHILKRRVTQTPLCMIVGETHAVEIAQSLCSLQWECLDEAVLYQKITPVHHNIKKVPDFEVRFKQALMKILEPLKVPVCAACHEAKTKLMKCSQCKKTVYCNAECQRKDWAAHKLTCEKVKVKIV